MATSSYSKDFSSSPKFESFSSTGVPSNLLSSTPLPPVVQYYLCKVYAHLFISVLFLTLGCYLSTIYSFLPRAVWLNLFIVIGLMFTLHWTPPHPHNLAKRRLLLFSIAFVKGCAIEPLITFATSNEVPESTILAACVASTIVFASLSISAMFARRRSYLALSSYLSMSLMAQLILPWFLPRETGLKVLLYGGMLTFLGYILKDTQKIIEKSADGIRDEVGDALTLLIDFVALFKRILVIMIRNKIGKDGKCKKSKK